MRSCQKPSLEIYLPELLNHFSKSCTVAYQRDGYVKKRVLPELKINNYTLFHKNSYKNPFYKKLGPRPAALKIFMIFRVCCS